MDDEGVEDMLFGPDTSQGNLEEATTDISDDDMLDCLDDDEELLWGLQDDSMLIPATDDDQHGKHIDFEETGVTSPGKEPSLLDAMRPARDRYCGSSIKLFLANSL